MKRIDGNDVDHRKLNELNESRIRKLAEELERSKALKLDVKREDTDVDRSRENYISSAREELRRMMKEADDA